MLSIYAWFGFELPMCERYRLIREAGFGGVLLWWDDSFGCPDFRAQPEAARRAGLAVENIHAPFVGCNALWEDTLDGAAYEKRLLSCVEDCHAYGIPAMVVHASGGGNPPPPGPLGLARMERIVGAAERLGVNVAVENLRKTAHPRYLLQRIGSPRLGFCYDSGHHHCRTPGEDVLGEFGGRLMALHLHDNDGRLCGADEEDRHRLPFDGTTDWPAVMKKIAASGYKGSTALEVVKRDGGETGPEEFLQTAFGRAKKLEELRCGV